MKLGSPSPKLDKYKCDADRRNYANQHAHKANTSPGPTYGGHYSFDIRRGIWIHGGLLESDNDRHHRCGRDQCRYLQVASFAWNLRTQSFISFLATITSLAHLDCSRYDQECKDEYYHKD